MAITLDGTLGITSPTYAGNVTAEYSVPVTGFKNRIINPAMVIDQRNAGASTSISVGDRVSYGVDRFSYQKSSSSYGVTSQRSTTAPSNFINSLVTTVTSAFSPASGDYLTLGQIIEGFNVADLGWGTANAQTITISFWVRSSVTGTYTFQVGNGAANRSYAVTYTVNASNTWEQKTATIAGDTSGTWATDNSGGLWIRWDLGSGSSFNGTTGSWQASGYIKSSSQVTWANNASATFYITGVQLEKGSTATSFDYRPYGTELQLCQRYFQIFGGAFNESVAYSPYCNGVWGNTTQASMVLNTLQRMRAIPTITYSSAGSFQCRSSGTSPACTNIYSDIACPTGVMFVAVIASGATAGYAAQLFQTASTLSSISFNAEL